MIKWGRFFHLPHFGEMKEFGPESVYNNWGDKPRTYS